MWSRFPTTALRFNTSIFALNVTELRSFFSGKEVWHETDYVVFRRSNDCAVVEVHKADRQELFCKITQVDIVSLPDTTRWVDDFTIDSGNPVPWRRRRGHWA